MNKEKNLDLLCYDFTTQLQNVINNCGLNVSVIEAILKNILNEVSESKRIYLGQKLAERVQMAKEEESGLLKETVVEVPITIEGEE